MMWLIRKKLKGKKAVAHVWNGEDTACRLWSTGGIGRSRPYEVQEVRGDHPICHMCKMVSGAHDTDR